MILNAEWNWHIVTDVWTNWILVQADAQQVNKN